MLAKGRRLVSDETSAITTSIPLEAALTLRERGLQGPRIVTGDFGMIARARALGLDIHRLDDKWLLPDEPV